MTVPELYNTYLSVSRGSLNKPWKPRKDFDGFDKTPDGYICKRLELFFKKFPQINPIEYFKAPYEVYKDEEHFPLNFYTTQKAIAIYSTVQMQKKEELPDTQDQIADIKKSLKYIASTCLRDKLTLSEYCSKKEGYTYKQFIDYNNKLINIYVLIKLPFFETQLNSLNLQDKLLYLKDTANNISKYKMRLNASVKAKKLVDEGLKLITNTTNTIDKTKL
jgi:hypothetical protein